MSRTRTLTNLLLDVRQRTNMENSMFVTDAEITEYLNQEIAELWSRLTQGAGQPYYSRSTSISVTSGTTAYALPGDFWVLQSVVATINGVTSNLAPFMPQERGSMVTTGLTAGVNSPVMYRIGNTNLPGAEVMSIDFLPATNTFTANVIYTPTATRLANGSDIVEGFNGFEVAAIYGACATILDKEKADPSFYIGQRERIYKHIDSLASQRDMGMPERVQEIVSYDDLPTDGWFL